MLNNITIGQYFPGNSFLHRMDPRAKIIATTIFVVAIFLVNSSSCVWFGRGIYHLCYVVIRLPLRLMWSAIKPLWIIIVFTMGIHIFTTQVIHFSNGALLILQIKAWLWVYKWRHD